MPDPKRHGRRVILLLACVAAAGLAALWWLCARSPNIPFLTAHGPAQWIIYPWPPDGLVHHQVELDTEFHRAFRLDQPPGKSILTLRAFRRFEIILNGARIETASTPPVNWKDPTQFDISKHLHAGTNYLSITVYNSNGPPALWLSLDAGGVKINTDPAWDASLVGAAWRPAWLASQPMEINPGNELYSRENIWTSLGRNLPLLLLFAAFSTAIVLAGTWCVKRIGWADPAKLTTAVFLFIAVFWVALFFNNMRLLPNKVGFDAEAHLDYINYIKTNHALPLATDGWEMCQAPLYYLTSALVISPLRSSVTGDAAIRCLRVLGLLIGLAQIWLVLLCLRLLFPDQSGKQIFGLILAGCLPELIYISQYVSNESMAALWTTAAIYFCLRILKQDRFSWPLAAATGLCLGAALLSKVTTVLAVPFIGGALLGWLWMKQAKNSAAWVRLMGVVFLTCVAVCGWHYFRVWRHFGSPVVNDWDPAAGFAWWTDQGFSTAGYYTRFGQSLVQPFYSGFHGFGDGIYSTLWGDGLFGGMQGLLGHPPWNYGLMSAGFLLALFPSALILIGVAACARRFLRQPEPIWFLLLGLPFTTLALLVYLNLKLPFCCAVKAFYGLMALLPMCAFGAVGWDVLVRRPGRFRIIFPIVLGTWAMAAFGSFWIRNSTAFPHVAHGLALTEDKSRYEQGVAELSEALRLNPHDKDAKISMAVALYGHRPTDKSIQLLAEALAEYPDDANGHVQLASILAEQGQKESAIQHAERATALEPDYALAYHHLCVWLSQLGRNQEALAMAREGLRLKPLDADLHFVAASILAGFTNHVEAVGQFRYACEFHPDWPVAEDGMGLSLTALGRWPEADGQFEHACKLEPNNAAFHDHLAGACVQTGRFKEAAEAAAKTIELAGAAGNANMSARNRKLLEFCREKISEASGGTNAAPR